MICGQLVIGPPGSGKSTYCNAVANLLSGSGRRIALVNLDPANEIPPYKADIDISQLIALEDVMRLIQLGPNGGLIHCMEFLEKKVDWLIQEMKKFSDCYFIIDCPGQVELYTHHDSMQSIVSTLQKNGISLSAVHLVDSHYCCDPGKFVAVLLTSLSTMLKMEMPHLNVLSKADLIEKNGKLHFNLDFYTEVLDLSELVDLLSDDPFLSRYKKLNAALKDVIENYSMVSFHVMTIKNKDSLKKVVRAADRANGYVFGVNEEDRNIRSMLSCAMGGDYEIPMSTEDIGR
ncbi:GPN-loop GTPase 2-like [Uloborus diversus]|uniref:GPN-loop GTPase 2-like n=1 Tax=Uloborus diversus TaxID=327109 RepID=UPI0024095CBE|nr:GPN-loop GTPase 2-like [Uloborus diversus]